MTESVVAEPESAIYVGKVRHRRFKIKLHCFSYKVFMMFADVENIQAITQRCCLWSYNKANIASFSDKDFLSQYASSSALSLYEKANAAIVAAGQDAVDGKIFLLSNWRYFSYMINPISCYYCYNKKSRLQYIIAEVTNTPWGECQVYVLPCDDGKKHQRLDFQKQMHVSPFFEMDVMYQLCSSMPSEKLSIHLENKEGDYKAFDATLALQRKKMSRANLYYLILRYPFMTLKVLFAIYWQALKLYLKGVAVVPHPKKIRKYR